MTTRRDFLKTFIAGGAASLVAYRLLAADTAFGNVLPILRADYSAADPWAEVPAILQRIKPPTFPERDFDITRFGAKGDGRTDCTESFRKAIAACNKAGGGRVLVPAGGSFLTGAIHLKSNVNLYVAKGATIKFSQDPKHYLPLVFTRWEGMELMNYSPFIYAFEQENIAITGEGTLDGQGDNEHWWPWKGQTRYGWKQNDPDQRKARRALEEMAEKGVPVNQRVFGEGHYLRPQFIEPYRSKNVLIEGVTILNSPMWEIHPVLCTNVTVRGVKISTHGPNNDGCDPESCRDVLIKDCDFDTGDDCIAIKSGRNADGRRLNTPSENIVIQDCRMKEGHGGVTIGSEISGGVRNVFAENCRLDSPNLDHALRVKNNAMRGGTLENLYFRNIEVGQVAHAIITIDFNYEEGEKGGFKPVVRNFVVQDLKSGKSKHAMDVQGFSNAPVYNLRLENCTFDNVARPSIVKNVEGLTLMNVRVNGKLVDNEQQSAKVRIVLVGDSTVTDKDGWGKGFSRRLGANVECINMAKGGRSSKSYMSEGWWKKALELKGDYILIQFGHNDMPGKGPERETDPGTTYTEYMTRYVTEARSSGAIPILLTSLTRRRFREGRINSDLIPYAEAVKRVAAKERVPLIDLHRLSIALIDSMGQRESDELGKMKSDGKGGQEMDYTHLGEKGSEVIGRLVADELRKVVPELAAHIS
jgi:polygalacturonase/lysophospholipase L1-like esterase